MVALPVTVDFSARTAAWSTAWKSKEETRCGFLSSVIWKSLALRPRTISPVFLSRTITLVRTMLTSLRRV